MVFVSGIVDPETSCKVGGSVAAEMIGVAVERWRDLGGGGREEKGG